MNRTRKLKIGWILLLITGLGGTYAWWWFGQPPTWAVVLVGVALLLPGRVQGHVYRDLFRGRALLDTGRVQEAVPCFERFLDTLARRPGLKHLLWLSWSVYATDPEVMARNNLGAARLRLGHLSEARSCLERALQLDPRAPMVHYNLALLAAVEGDSTTSDRHLQTSRDLGLSRSWDDRFIQASQQILAALEGRARGRRG